MTTLKDLGVIPVTRNDLAAIFPCIQALNQKLFALEKAGELIRLKRGLYVVSPTLTGLPLSKELISNHIYGPSYVSQETALRYYGLIPEQVHLMQAVTTKHTRIFENALGRFEYTGVPRDYFAIGITFVQETAYSFLIATPEKALCDLILFRSKLNLRYKREILAFLADDLRLDMDAFYQMNPATFRAVATCGKKVEVFNQIASILEGVSHE